MPSQVEYTHHAMKIGLPDPTPIGAARETGGALVKAPRTTPKKDIKVTRDNELGVALRVHLHTNQNQIKTLERVHLHADF